MTRPTMTIHRPAPHTRILLSSCFRSVVLTLLLLTPVSALAESDTSTFVDDFLTLDKGVATKYSQLAEAIPAEKLDWRPSDEARSISEVLLHIAQTNFGVAKAASIPMPESVPSDLSQVEDKDTIIALVDESFSLFHQAAEGVRGMDLSKPFPGQTRPSLRMLLYAHTEHHGEHLGQLIAYSRSIGVTPPWSR